MYKFNNSTILKDKFFMMLSVSNVRMTVFLEREIRLKKYGSCFRAAKIKYLFQNKKMIGWSIEFEKKLV